MKWEDFRASDNIEDRRGEDRGGPGAAPQQCRRPRHVVRVYAIDVVTCVFGLQIKIAGWV